MKKTPIRLADGRDLIYFDESDDTVRDQPDQRPLGPIETASEARYDPLLDEWVLVASHRQDRTYLPPPDQCPLCPSRNGRHTEIPAPQYDVVVFENRFPALTQASRGRCEVVCFTDDHDASFAELTPERVGTVMAAWIDRTTELSDMPGVEQVFCFENRGKEIGVTLSHPHGQIYAYPFVTPRTSHMLAAAAAHRRRERRNLFDDVLAAERRDGTRVVARTADWTAFVPRAARWPYEVHLYPHRRVPDMPELNDAERDQFGELYLDILRRFDRLFDSPTPYIAAWHQAPLHSARDDFALHMELFTIRRAADRLKYLAGSESAMDAFINDIPPEVAADRLRNATS